MMKLNEKYLYMPRGTAKKMIAAGAAVLVVILAARVGAYAVQEIRLGAQVKAAGADGTDENEKTEPIKAYSEKANRLKQNNPFVEPPKKQHPINAVTGILGSQVLINGKWYGQGETVNGAKIVAIEPTRVEIEWENEKKWFSPIASQGAGGPPPPPGPGPEMKKGRRRMDRMPERIKRGPETATPQPTMNAEDPYAWLGVPLSDKAKKLFDQVWNGMSEERKQQAKEEWNKMSQADKEKAVASLEEQAAKM